MFNVGWLVAVVGGPGGKVLVLQCNNVTLVRRSKLPDAEKSMNLHVLALTVREYYV